MLIRLAVVTAIVSSGGESDIPRSDDTCLIQHLNSKLKLDYNFESIAPICRLLLPAIINMLKSAIRRQIQTSIPDHADCFISEFENREAIDHLLKIRIILKSEVLEPVEQETELSEVINDFKNDLNRIATRCQANDVKVFEAFGDFLIIKNRTDLHYCLAKYAVDRNLLLLENVQVIPHERVDVGSVNCEQIVEIERIKKEMELRTQLDRAYDSEVVKDCTMQTFRNENGFDIDAHLVAINYLPISRQEKQAENKRIDEKIAEFVSKAALCTL